MLNESLDTPLDKLARFVSIMALVTVILVSSVSMLGAVYQLHFIGWKNSEDGNEIKKAVFVPTQIIVQQQQQDPILVLKLRFVNGEITEDEYMHKKELLES